MSEIGDKTDILYVDETSWMVLVYVLAGAFIIYIAWCSTRVRHDLRGNLYRQRTVFIINPQTGDFQQQQHPIGVSLNDFNAHWHTPPPTLESILDEVNGITSGATYHIQRQELPFDADFSDDDAQAIIQEMDRDGLLADGVRYRRTNNVRDDDVAAAAEPTTSTAATATPASAAPHRMQRTSNIVDDEPHIYPVIDEVPTIATAATDNYNYDGNASIASGSDTNDTVFGDELTIKLKYLNDDLKIVKARPNEAIGDFKK